MNKPWPFRPMHGPNCNVLCMLYLVLQLCKNLLEKIIKLLLRLYVVYHNWKKTNNYTINLWRDKDRERERQTETERERERRERHTHTHRHISYNFTFNASITKSDYIDDIH